MDSSDRDSVRYHWRGPFANEELNTLHAEVFGHPVLNTDWLSQVERFSLGWVTARDPDGLLGFVNVLWDGSAHAFLIDTTVATRAQRRGVGTQLVRSARENAAAAGCEWLHVDFESHLRDFYLESCGFQPTAAGLIRLR